jgi:Ca2+/Na+ antiporter
MKTKKFICPNCGQKQKFYHTIFSFSFTTWTCPNCGSIIKLDTAISIPFIVVAALVFIIFLNDSSFWAGCSFFVFYVGFALVIFYNTVKLKLVSNYD